MNPSENSRRQPLGPGTPWTSQQGDGTTTCIFRPRREMREVAFDGPPVVLKDTTGLKLISGLLARPGVPVGSYELQVAVGLTTSPWTIPHSSAGMESNLGLELAHSASCIATGADALADPQAVKAIAAEIQLLEAERDDLRARGEYEEADIKEDKIDTLREYLRGTRALASRQRVFNAPPERARKATSKAIHRALKLLHGTCPLIYDHLKDSLHIGSDCAYLPSRLVSWML